MENFVKAARNLTYAAVAGAAAFFAPAAAIAGGPSTSVDGSYGGRLVTGGSIVAVNPTGTFSYNRGGIAAEVGAAANITTLNGSSAVQLFPIGTFGPTADTRRAGGLDASVDASYSGRSVTGNSTVSVTPQGTFAFGVAGGNGEVGASVQIKTLGGGSQVLVAPTGFFGPAIQSSGLHP